eukprot:3628830-Amphidinium_carterae.1
MTRLSSFGGKAIGRRKRQLYMLEGCSRSRGVYKQRAEQGELLAAERVVDHLEEVCRADRPGFPRGKRRGWDAVGALGEQCQAEARPGMGPIVE